jgi:hypothetical protein
MMRFPTWAELISAIGSIGAWITAWYAASKVKEVHVLINSRLSALLDLTKTSSFEAGKKAEGEKRDLAIGQAEHDKEVPK